jgi:pimeloyl-ACP methyl ester carboxylesterase
MADWKKASRTILLTVAIAYVVLCAGAFVCQRRLMYFPTKIPAKVVESVAREHGFSPWKNAAGKIIGWKIPATGAATGSVLIVHGNAGCALGRDYIARPIHDAADVDVYVLEYPGYGAREGSPGRPSLCAAAEEAFQCLNPDLPRYVVSESIGTGVAGELASRHPAEIAGLALIVPYYELAAVAQRQMWFLPAYFLLLDRFDPAQCLKNYHGPVQFVVAGDDEILGPATGRKLFDHYAGPKQLEFIPGARHNDAAAQPADWWRTVFHFWGAKR